MILKKTPYNGGEFIGGQVMTEKTNHHSGEKILEVAVLLFSEKGLASVSMEDIAERAEMTLEELHEVFAGKKEILAAYFKEKSSEVSASLEKDDDFKSATSLAAYRLFLKMALKSHEGDFVFLKQLPQSLKGLGWMVSVDALNCRVEALKILKKCVDKSSPFGPGNYVIAEILFEVYMGILAYRIQDESEGGEDTLVLVDKISDFLESFVQTEVFSKGIDLFTYAISSPVVKDLGEKIPGLNALKAGPLAKLKDIFAWAKEKKHRA